MFPKHPLNPSDLGLILSYRCQCACAHCLYNCGPGWTDWMSPEEVRGEYERNVGKVIVERFTEIEPMEVPAVLVAGHGPFTWGASAADAVHNAAILEHLSALAIRTLTVEPYSRVFPRELLDKHYYRKHGEGAYYGQGEGGNVSPRRHGDPENGN